MVLLLHTPYFIKLQFLENIQTLKLGVNREFFSVSLRKIIQVFSTRKTKDYSSILYKERDFNKIITLLPKNRTRI